MRWPKWVLVLVVLAGCPRVDTGEDGGVGPINATPEGGLFVRAGYAIDIPKGAVSEAVQITVTVIDTGIPEVMGRKRISYGYRFSPTSLTFAAPVKIYLPWVDERVPKGVTQDSFDMRRQAGSDAFLSLPGAKTSTLGEFSFVEAPTSRLGVFWDTSPSEPNIDRLQITPDNASITVGETLQLKAQVVAPTGDVLEEIPVAWRVVPPRVGSVDANGLFTSTAPGIATVTATAGSKSATATVNVFGTAVGPATYVHENPFPTGNDLWGGALVPGGLGVAFVGTNGTVLTRSFTNQWGRILSSPGVVFRGIAGTTAENAVAVGSLGTTGVLASFKGVGVAPEVSVYRTVEPHFLWFDGTHGMAVGVGNDVLIYREAQLDGGTGAERSWQTEYSPSFEALLDVVGDGADHYVTVGARGSIYRWDPVRKLWDSLYQTQLATLLTAAVITSETGSEAWAVGGNKLWHFKGDGWLAENFPAIAGFAEATAIDQVDHRLIIGIRRSKIFGVESEGLILTYRLPAVAETDADGGVLDAGTPGPQWTSFSTRNPQVPRGVFGGGVDSAVGYVVGDYGSVYQWDGATLSFTELSHGFYGNVRDISALPDDVVATVNECLDAACTAAQGRVIHRAADGGFEELGEQSFGGPLYGVLALSANDVIVSASNSVWHYDGVAWAPIDINGQVGALHDFKVCGGAVWATGAVGEVFQGTTTQLVDVGSAASGTLYSLWCPNDTEVWAAGDGVMTAKIGAQKWAAKTSSKINPASWRAVWAPGGGEGFAFGLARYGIYWNTESLSTMEPLPVVPDVINGMWGSTIDNLYAVGYQTTPYRLGFALRFDGVQWKLVDSGSQRSVTAIDGTSSTNIWLGTEGGGLLRAVPPQ